MSVAAHCENPGRLQQLREQSAINAIEYLIVVDGAGVPAGLRQRILLVHFLFDTGVGGIVAGQVRVEGGVRVENPAVRWAVRLSDLNPATIDPDLTGAEQDHLTAIQTSTADATEWLIVMLQQYGDHSLYTLMLRDNGLPPAGFDLILSEVRFSFKVECPTQFDCAEDESCPTVVAEEPELDYLARDFKSLRRLMFDRMALIAPDDTSRDPATLRAVIVETLAYAADRLAYFQDAVSTEAYLGTARTRPSVRRHARLLDHPMHEGCNSRTFVHLQLENGRTAGGSPLRPGAAFYTRLSSGGTVLVPSEVAQALAEGPAVFEALSAPATFTSSHNAIAFHTWGDAECCLPEGATAADLVDDGLDLQPGDFLLLEQTRAPDTALEEDADPSKRHVVRLTEVEGPVVDELLASTSVLTVRWHESDALPFALPLSKNILPLAVARANLVLADHGLTIEHEGLEFVSWGNQRGLRATLARTGLTWVEKMEDDVTAQDLLFQDPREARASIRLRGENEAWTPPDDRDLLGSTSSSREFVVEMEGDGRARLRFGDTVMGRMPADLSDFTATYRIGNGPEGNVGAEAISHLVTDVDTVDAALSAAVVAVRNPVAATGGSASESIDEVKLYAPQAFRVQQRAVTVADWVEVTERHAHVQRAVADLRWTGSWNTVFVTVDPIAGQSFELLKDELVEFLEPFRLAGYDLQVVPPIYVPLDIALTVCVEDHHFQEDVEAALMQEFGTGYLDDGRRGFFHPDEFTFGQSVWLSQVITRSTSVAGVRWVDVNSTVHENRFKRRGELQGSEIADGRIRIAGLEIARCDNDRNFPDNGEIRFFMEGGA